MSAGTRVLLLADEIKAYRDGNTADAELADRLNTKLRAAQETANAVGSVELVDEVGNVVDTVEPRTGDAS